jgi:hypothetical protein
VSGGSTIVGLHPWFPFTQHPCADGTRTVRDVRAVALASVPKPHSLYVDEFHLRAVSHNLRITMLDLLRSFLKARRVQFLNEPQWCALAAVRSVNLESQVVSSTAQQTYCKTWATPRLLYSLHLEKLPALCFQLLPNFQHTRASVCLPSWEKRIMSFLVSHWKRLGDCEAQARQTVTIF